MASISIRQLRDTQRLKALLRAGKTVELRDRNRLIGRIVPETVPSHSVEWPDFAARQRKLFGNRVFPGADLVVAERERSHY